MNRTRVVLLTLLIIGGFSVTAPATSACSLVGYRSLTDLSWPAADRLDTNTGNSPGRVNLEPGKLIAILDQYSFASAASPDGRWLVASYFDGSLGADCTMEFVTTDAFDLETGERVRLFDGATHAMATSADHVYISAYECGPVVHVFEWGEWDEPARRFDLAQVSGAPEDFEHVTGLAVNRDATRLAVATDWDELRMFDFLEGIFKDGRADLMRGGSAPGPMFAMQPDGLRVAVVQGDHDEARVAVYDSALHFERVFSYAFANARADDRPVGAPAWQPDGGAVAFASSAVLTVVDADQSKRQVVLPSSAEFLGSPAWSPDGARIAIGTDGVSDGDGSLSIYTEALDLERRITWNEANPFVKAPYASWEPPIDDFDVEPRHACASGEDAQALTPVPSVGFLVGLGVVAAAAFLVRRH